MQISLLVSPDKEEITAKESTFSRHFLNLQHTLYFSFLKM